MSIAMVVTAGYGNGTISGSIADVVLRGYSIGSAAAWYPYWAPRSVKTIGAFIMYARNAASPQRISVGPVVQVSDGAVQTSGVSIAVMPQAGASGAGGGTTAYDNGTVLYTPTQAETNYASFVVTAYKTGCIPASVTVVTTASSTAGYAAPDWAAILAPTTTVNLSGTTVKTATDVETDTADIQSRIPAALVSGRIDASVGAMAANTVTASALAADAVTEIQSGLATQASVDDLPTNAELATALGTADDAILTQVALVKAKTDSLTFTVAGVVDANIQRINDVTVTGDGSAGDKFDVV